MNTGQDDAEAAPEPSTLRAGSWPRRRLTVEALGLILIFVLVLLALTYVFVITRNSEDVEAVAAGVETLSSLAAVLAGAMAGYLGRSALGDAPVRTEPPLRSPDTGYGEPGA